MKYLIACIMVLFCSLSFAADKYLTDVPGVYIKNFKCKDNYMSGNLVNKSDKYIGNIYLNLFDEDGDPINRINISGAYATANSGRAFSQRFSCSTLYKIGFSTR
ncbi:hypothetical protein N9J50_01265 [Methylophilaceae bacterium]|jgi:hypothetical protein|nr:hypothetical protein [Methylophilaceae bacterium]